VAPWQATRQQADYGEEQTKGLYRNINCQLPDSSTERRCSREGQSGYHHGMVMEG